MHKTIAVCGKGGVGKTSVTALMLRALMRLNNRRILAIDADPATGLATALGITVPKTVDDIRKELIQTIKLGQSQDKADTMARLDYEVFGALAEQKNLALLAIGRPEDEGCFCKVNNLLKDIIQGLADKFDIVLIDGEAGVEQINRRVMKTVDTLVLVSDTSAKAVNVVRTITHLAQDNKAVDYRDIGLIVNRVRHPDEVDRITAALPIKLFGYLPDDDGIRAYDFDAKPLLDLPDDSPSSTAVQALVEQLMQ